MAATSTFVNPTATDELLVFYSTPNNCLALETRKTKSSGGDTNTYSAADVSTLDGGIRNPSCLAAILNNNLIAVYGVFNAVTTNPCNCNPSCQGTITSAQDYGDIYLFSPAFMPLGIHSDIKYGRLGASFDKDKDDAWLYYRRKDELSKIYEIKLSDDNAQKKLSKADHVGDETYITAYYDSGKSCRHVVYQDEDETIYDYNIDKNICKDVGITDAIYPTGLATIYANNKVYLYYSHKAGSDYCLRRAVRDSSGASGGDWASSASVSDASNLCATTQISATVTADTSPNHVIYKNTSGKFEHILDSW